MDVVAERRFHTLKKRLDALQYCQPLGLDSAALVERLLNDLLKTTEGFQALKKQNKSLEDKQKNFNGQIDPLKRENSRLVKQNNDLHLEIMRIREESDDRDNKWRLSVKTLESEANDLKFVIEKCRNDLKRSEQQNNDLKQRLESAIAGAYLPSQQKGVVAAQLKQANQNVQSRPQTFETSKRHRDIGEIGDKAAFNRENSDWANEIRDADERVRKTMEELENLHKESELSKTQVYTLSTQVENRDKEIVRLTSFLEDGPDMEKLTNRYAVTDAKDSVSNMNAQMDYLNSENTRLGSQLNDANDKLDRCNDMIVENRELQVEVQNLRENNAGLKSNLKHLKDVAQRLEEYNECSDDKTNAQMADELATTKVAHENLRQVLDSTKLENLRLQEDIKNGERLAAQFTAEKQSFHNTMDRMTAEKTKVGNNLVELSSNNGKLELELKNAREELKIAKQQMMNMKHEIELNQNSMSKINSEHLATTEEAYTFRQKLSVLENQKSLLESEVQNLRFELERAQKMKMAAEDHLEMVKNETYKTKTEMDSSAAQKQRVTVLYEGAQKELEIVKEENANLSRLRESDRRAINDMERNITDLQTQLSAAKENVQVVQREHQVVSDELQKKLDELRYLETARLSLERELEELRPVRQRLQESINEIRIVKEGAAEKDLEGGRKGRLLEDMEQQIRNLNNENTNMNEIISRVNGEKQMLEQKLENAERHQGTLNASIMRGEARDGELEAVKEELKHCRDKERELLREIERCKGEIMRMEDKVTSTARQLEHAEKQKADLASELDKSRVDFTTTQAKESERKSHTMKLEEQVFQSNLAVEELRRQLGAEQMERNRLDDEILQLKRGLESEKTHNERLNEQIQHLKSLIESLEKVREDLLVKLQSANMDRSSEESQRTTLIGQVSELRAELNRKTDQVNDLHESMKNLDQDRDYVQNLLDQKTEQLAAIQGSVTGQHQELAELKSQTSNLQARDDANLRKLDERDQAMASLNEQVRALNLNLDEQRGKNSHMYRENQELTDSVNMITRENQKINEEMMRLVQERDRLRGTNEDIANSERLAQQMAKNVEREKESILETYKKVCEENERAAHSVSAMNEEQKEYFYKLQQCEQELLNAQEHIRKQEDLCSNYEAQITTLERNVSHLTVEVENAERRTNDALNMKEELARDVTATRQLSMGLETTNEDIQRKIAMTENEKMLSETRSKQLENEVRALSKNLEYEKTRFSDLEAVLAKERENAYKLQLDYSKAEEERHSLKDQVQKGKMSTASSPDRYDLERKLDENRNEILNLEMEQMRLREENGKTKHLLFKAESKIADLESQLQHTKSYKF